MRARLGQVCLNLVLNAIQSFEEDDPTRNQVEIRVERDSDDWALVQIRDNGAGIPAKLLPRIFDPFFTTKASGRPEALVVKKGSKIRGSNFAGIPAPLSLI